MEKEDKIKELIIRRRKKRKRKNGRKRKKQLQKARKSWMNEKVEKLKLEEVRRK